ncbi:MULTISPECIES: flavin reductase family protein [unclassified Streptomyces]|uniref:flavin reductase family protein n=1 Tax=unclassified Streptomyces TaxID=2593676 RepID=UPI00081F0087|nr:MULTISPECIES: flavin reductase family protein [unclassified Streptomyces]MYZ35138.1 flavin reductase [Streptomyces sp. SID4917]SCF73013.1 NADH-FMN oxidoreductase RutF, flavin reductase (DIM6/NTAB) family [Streptomyces sp. MnatMP-M17]
MLTSTYENARHSPASDSPPVGEALRSAMRLFPTGVALLTAGEGAQATAMTINALMSVSLTPPQVLVSVLHTARLHPVLEHTGTFAVHLLAGDQAATAELFSSSEKPSGPALRPFLTAHVLPRVLTSLSCVVQAVYPGGDHSLFLGHVEKVKTEAGAAERQPLIFHRGVLREAGGVGPAGTATGGMTNPAR